MSSRGLIVLAAAAAVTAMLIARVVYTVFPWQHNLLLQFGEVVSVNSEPGLFFKLPWQEVLYMDSRILTIDTDDTDRFITAEKENVLVDSFIKWRIEDPRVYYKSVSGSERLADVRLVQMVNRSLRDEIGKRTVKQVVSGDRDKVRTIIRESSNATAGEIGVSIIDVHIKRVELPQQVSENVYRNMIEERRRVANERRASGDAESEKIRADADKQRTIILAEAQREAEILKGKGDSEAAQIYADSYSANPEFFAFKRSLDAYRASFSNSSDFMVLDTNTDFLRYFKDQAGAKRR